MLNILYEGITNPIYVSVEGYSKDDINVSAINGCTLEDISTHKKLYLLKTNGAKKETRVYVSLKTRTGRHSSLGYQTYRIRPLPILDAQLGGIKNDGKPKSIHSVRAQTSIYSSPQPSFPYQLKSLVNSYTCTIYSSGKDTSFTVNSNKISEELKWAIQPMQSGDFLAFTDINYTIINSVDSTVNIAPPIFIPIK